MRPSRFSQAIVPVWCLCIIYRTPFSSVLRRFGHSSSFSTGYFRFIQHTCFIIRSNTISTMRNLVKGELLQIRTMDSKGRASTLTALHYRYQWTEQNMEIYLIWLHISIFTIFGKSGMKKSYSCMSRRRLAWRVGTLATWMAMVVNWNVNRDHSELPYSIYCIPHATGSHHLCANLIFKSWLFARAGVCICIYENRIIQ